MYNEFIEDELNKIKGVEKIDEYNFVVRKSSTPKFQLNQGGEYIIKLADYVINEPPTFTLSSNWNKGEKFKSKYMHIFVNKTVGKMILISGCGYDVTNKIDLDDRYFNMYLPLKSIEIEDVR